MPREYPEPSILGILPSYGLYARHVKGLQLNNVSVKFDVPDERPAVVLDDVADARFSNLSVMTAPRVPAIVEVTNTKKREAELDYVKETPYKTTTVTGLVVSPKLTIEHVTVNRPSPGTPPDSLYSYPTAPSTDHPFAFSIPDDKYPLPLTVYRPTFDYIGDKTIAAGSPLQFAVVAITPVADAKLNYSAAHLPAGAAFDPATRTFSWTPAKSDAGDHAITFIVDDGVLPESTTIKVTVQPVR
jgi:hypothetical protein